MQRKIFWIIFLVLDTVAGFTLPMGWALLASFPLVVIAWWLAYRSGLMG